MGEKAGQKGRCLCGAVKYEVEEPVLSVGICHCDMCRRWAGGAWAVIHCTGPVTFKGEEHIVRYESSDWAERGFCGKCGTTLFYSLRGRDEYALSAGTLDDQASLKLNEQIFVDEKPVWYDFANKTGMLTGAEVFAKYAPDGDS